MRRLCLFTTLGLSSLLFYKMNCKNVYCDIFKIMVDHKLKQLDVLRYRCSCTEDIMCYDCWVRDCNKINY